MIAEYLEKKGEARGERKGERNLALRLMDKGMPMDQVIEYTEFSARELEAFRQEREQEREAAGNEAE